MQLTFIQAQGDQQFLSFLQSLEHFTNCKVFFLWDSWKNYSKTWILESLLFTKSELAHETVCNVQLHPQSGLAQPKSSKIPEFCGLPGVIFILIFSELLSQPSMNFCCAKIFTHMWFFCWDFAVCSKTESYQIWASPRFKATGQELWLKKK